MLTCGLAIFDGWPDAVRPSYSPEFEYQQGQIGRICYQVSSASEIRFSDAGQARATIRSWLNSATTGRPISAAERRTVLTESVGTPGFTSVGSLPSSSTTSRGRPKYPRGRDRMTTAPAPASPDPSGRAARRCTISDEPGNGER